MNSDILIDINIRNLASVDLAQIKALPDCPAIYFVMYLDGQILYIGQASNLRTRWQGHHRLPQLISLAKKNPIKVAWLQTDYSSLDTLEKAYIKHLIPILNDTKVPSVLQNSVSGKKILQQSLQKIAPYTVVCGICRDLVDLAYGIGDIPEQSIEQNKIKAVKDRKLLLSEYGQTLNSHPKGAQDFPLQAGAIVREIAGVEMLVLTHQQLNYIHSQQKGYSNASSLHPDYSQLDIIDDDPIKVFY